MIAPGDKIVAGVSGGADSVCLLLLLVAYGRKCPLSLTVVHVNHGLREEAGEDAGYVEELCRQRDIPFFLTEANVHGLALEEKCSLEDAGRRIRYRAFREAADRMGGGKVAVAHNSNDNAETMLFHLFRGSGIKGMSGIAPIRTEEDGTCILRPILCLEREEIEAYLREREIVWRRDSTNDGDDYSRNRIRHHILPYAQREVASGTVGRMLQTGELLRETESYLQEQTEKALGECTVWEGSISAIRYLVDVEAFLGFHEALRSRMLFILIKRLSPTGKDISAVHVRDALGLFVKEGNRQIALPFGITVRRQYGQVVLEHGERGKRSRTQAGSEKSVEVPLTEEIFRKPFVHDLGDMGKVEFIAFFLKKQQELPRNQCTKWFDYDKIKERVDIRFRGSGDFFTITDKAGNMVHKSLKAYMIGEKIPQQLRDSIPVVAMGNHILWLVGWRISEYFKVDEDTRRVLQVRWIKNQEEKTEEKNVGAHQDTFARRGSGCKDSGHWRAD